MTAQILRRLMHRFGLLLVLTVLGGTAGAVYSATKTPTYQATAYVVVTAEAGEPFAAVNFAQAYGRVATTGPAAVNAAQTIGAGAPRDLARVTASTSPDAPVIEITAAGADAGRVQLVANAVAQGLIDFAATRKAETRVGVSMLAPAAKPARPSSPKPPLELAVGAAAGLLLAGLAALAGVGRSALTRRRDTDPADTGDDPVSTGGNSAETQHLVPANRVPAPRAAIANPSPTLSALTGSVLTPPATVSASAPVSMPPGTVSASASVPVEIFQARIEEPIEGQIEEPDDSASTAKMSRIVGRAVVIYREES
jgi:capsular polysaccharide biosynthesis protein